MISTFPATLKKFSFFKTEGCCSLRLFYQLAGFNHPSVSSNAEQWVSSISKGLPVIEFTVSEGFYTCAYVRKTCLTNDSISGSLSFCHFSHAHKEQWLRGWVPRTGFFLVLLPFCYPWYIPSILLINIFMNQINAEPLSLATLMSTKTSGRRFSKTKRPFPTASFIAVCWCVQGQRASEKTQQLLN